MNDQHTFVRGADLNVGDVVRLGLSHPCTAFDKWRLIPVVSDVDEPDPIVVDLIHTYF
jgi:D-serine deaminase-like pyridoxal phosphate-dependent protein